jgi:hypothetical protein
MELNCDFSKLNWEGTAELTGMERRALVLALALTVPLALYAVPYTYAAVTSSSYIVYLTTGTNFLVVHCHSGDYATGGGGESFSPGHLSTSSPYSYDFVTNSYSPITSGTPNAWWVDSVGEGATGVAAWVICQTPITIGGIGVPQFGSLYVAIALGAVVYFMMARRFARRPTISAGAKA